MAIVKIDFTSAASPPAGWNSISGPGTTGVRIADLLDDDGNATGISIEQIQAYDSGAATGLGVTGTHHGWPESVWNQVWADSFATFQHFFTLAGLPNGEAFSLLVAGHRGLSRSSEYRLTDSSGTTLDTKVYVATATTTPAAPVLLSTTVPANGILRFLARKTSTSFSYLTGFEFDVDVAAASAKRRRIVSVIG